MYPDSSLICRIWFEGLCSIVRGLKYQLQLTDRRMIWLREQYIQLYLDEGNFSKPMVMDAIRVSNAYFSTFDWSLSVCDRALYEEGIRLLSSVVRDVDFTASTVYNCCVVIFD